MKPQKLKTPLLSRKKDKLSLSGQGLVVLLEAVLDKKARFRFQAKGFSMSPFIKDGDVVTLYPLSECSPVIGDVVAFIRRSSGKLVVHRLTARKSGCFYINGDNTPETDGPVHRSDILGCVKRVERNGKKVLLGFGPEKYFIALLSRARVLHPLLAGMRRLLQPSFRLRRIHFDRQL